jgi:hypothetical protein
LCRVQSDAKSPDLVGLRVCLDPGAKANKLNFNFIKITKRMVSHHCKVVRSRPCKIRDFALYMILFTE